MIPLVVLTVFTSAALLFMVQPMIARELLPLLGGTPAVWSTAMLFFQGSLLLGYLLAHAFHRLRRLGRASVVVVFGLGVLTLPVGIPAWAPPADRTPIPWVLLAMAAGVGLPFVALSMTNPLLQAWLARTSHPRASNPYPLYAASNAGSFLGLLAYPALLEPNLSLSGQRAWWSLAYGLFVLMIGACAVVTLRHGPKRVDGPREAAGAPGARTAIAARRVFLWMLLAAIPSGLMLGVTHLITTDVAPVPLLWIVPLSLYLLTFVAAFGRLAERATRLSGRLVPGALVIALLLVIFNASSPMVMIVALHLVAFTVVSLFLHGAMAGLRPSPDRLTEFYIAVSAGGVLGGVFVSLIAPLVFNDVHEYPVLLSLVALTWWGLAGRPGKSAGERATWSAGDWVERYLHPALVLLVVFLLWSVLYGAAGWLARRGIVWNRPVIRAWIPAGITAVVCYTFSARRSWFAPACLALALVAVLNPDPAGRVVARARSYFGVHKVVSLAGEWATQLQHGTTLHGAQLRDSATGEPLSLPTTYYHPTGPIGQVFESEAFAARVSRVGLIGMGAGSIASFATPAMTLDFFEIDPVVVRIARDPRYFTFLNGSQAREINVILGDGRVTLARRPAATYDLIVVDAFGSDAVPVHLLTREAVDLYVSRLSPGGLVAVHISNKHLDLEPVLANIAREAGYAGCIQQDSVTLEQALELKFSSTWVLLARTERDLRAVARPGLWPGLQGSDQRVWTDDYSNILGVMSW